MGITKIVYRVDVGADKRSDQTRSDRVSVVKGLAPQTPLYQSDPAFKLAIDDYATAGDDFTAKNAVVIKLEAQLDAARGARDDSRVVLDLSHGVCIRLVEKHSATPADVQTYGFPVLDKVDLGIPIPSGIDARYDATIGAMRVHVLYPTRARRTCVIEISGDPIGAATYKRQEGTGIVRVFAGFAPGTWWIRAATTKATQRSDWAGPVAVIIK